MNARQHAAWLQDGGGDALIDDLLADRGLIAVPLGDTGGQMAGWFRKEVHHASDFAGMKVRIGGFAGKVFETLGATAGRRCRRTGFCEALSKGSLDAFEWVGPYDDEKFGGAGEGAAGSRFRKSRRIIITPDGGRAGCSCISSSPKKSSRRLPKPSQAAVARRGRARQCIRAAEIRRRQPGALKRLVVGGAQLRLFSQDILEACYKSTNDLYAQFSQDNPRFKKIADSYMAFRADEYLWWQVAEYSFDNFMIRERRAKG